MKKWIAIILIIISFFTTYIFFDDNNKEQLGRMINAEYFEKNTYSLLMPAEVTSQSQEDVYKKIKIVLTKYQGNMFFKRLDNNTRINYVYLSTPDYLAKYYTLNQGRFLNEADFSNDTDYFLSTKNTGSTKQIGQIADFGGNDDLRIETLKSMIENNQLYNGYCTVQFNPNVNIDSFTHDLSEAINGSVTYEGLNIIESNRNHFSNYLAILVLYLVIILLILYDILKSYKEIGIKKMLGYSTKEIWLNKVLTLLSLQLLIAIISYAIFSIIKIQEFNALYWQFTFKIIGIYAIGIFISFLIFSIPFLHINKIKVSDMLKNKKPVSAIVIFNYCIKISMVAVFLILISHITNNFTAIKNEFTNSYSQWENTKNYVYIKGYKIQFNNGPSEEYISKLKTIYEYFNKREAILVDFSDFTPDSLKMLRQETSYSWERDWVTINPNYLKENPVYDVDGNRVFIEETDNNYVTLIPDKYRSSESEILKKIAFWKNGSREPVKSQQIKVIWIKSGQKLFSYNINVNPDQGNYVTDALINVKTESNMKTFDYMYVANYKGNPFKIKIDNTLEPAESVENVLSQLDLNIYQPIIISVYDTIAAESKSVRDMVQNFGMAIALLVMIIVIVLMQNIYNYFDLYKQRLVVQSFHGYKKYHKYLDFYFLMLLSWIIIFNSALFLGNIQFLSVIGFTLSFSIKEIFALTICLYIIEVVFTLLYLPFVEKKKIVEYLKRSV